MKKIKTLPRAGKRLETPNPKNQISKTLQLNTNIVY